MMPAVSKGALKQGKVDASAKELVFICTTVCQRATKVKGLELGVDLPSKVKLGKNGKAGKNDPSMVLCNIYKRVECIFGQCSMKSKVTCANVCKPAVKNLEEVKQNKVDTQQKSFVEWKKQDKTSPTGWGEKGGPIWSTCDPTLCHPALCVQVAAYT